MVSNTQFGLRGMSAMHEKHLTLTRTFTGDDVKKCFYIGFDVPENVEALRIQHSWHPQVEGNLDFGLVGPDGRQIGASGNVRQDVTISEKYATPGYDAVTPQAGRWKIIVGTDRVGSGVTATYHITFIFKERRWFKGDTHLHTFNSDGKYSPEQLIEKAKRKKLDYIIITDHNNSVAAHTPRNEPDLLVMKGVELTSFLGHINFWGAERPFTTPYCVNSFEDFLPIYEQARESGAVISINHPECKNCGWHLPREGFHYDCVEVWNGPQRIDNMAAVDWWHQQLLAGKKIAAVGGSDYHRDYAVTDLLALPTTFVCAQSCTAADILDALRSGHAFISSGVNGPRLYLTCGGAIQGDTVPYTAGIKIHIDAERLRRGDRLVVYENDRIAHEYRAERGGSYRVNLPVTGKGFIRAEILTDYGAVRRAAYHAVCSKMMPADVKLPLPPMARCVSNPIYFE